MPSIRKIHIFDALRFRRYRFYWVASLLLYAARWMQMVVLGWLVLELTNSAFMVGLAGAFQWGPMLLGPFTGFIADRLNRRVVLIFVQFASALACLLQGILIVTGIIQVWHIMLLSLFLGITWAIDWPCRRSIIPDLVGEGNVLNGVALDNSAGTVMVMFGSIAGGQFISAIGMGNCYYLIGVMYLASTLCFFLIRKTEQRSITGDVGISANVTEGIKYIFKSQPMLAVLVITIIMNALVFPYRQLLPVFARDVLEVGSSGLGYLAAAQGLGAFCGSITLASIRDIPYRGRAFLGGSFAAAVLLVVFASSNVYLLSLGSLAVAGFAMAFFGTLQSTILLGLSAEEMRGRVMGILSLAIGVMSLGILVFGAIADVTGASLVVGVGAIIAAISVMVISFSISALRRLH